MWSLTELTDMFGSIPNIPQDQLYEALINSKTALAAYEPAALRASSLGQYVTHLCKTDLFWMARYFTWETNPAGVEKPISENNITEDPYRVLCDLFVKKDPSKTLSQQDEIKNRLLLWPRGGMKSTIDIVDVVQWILNFPDIRVLFLTGADDLAVGFVSETKGHFTKHENGHTLMSLFFPEFCVPEKNNENQFEFTCPVWAAKGVKRKEPTVLASSVGSTKSGTHFELVKADDSVTDRNSESTDQCATVSKKLSMSRKLLRLGGYYYDFIGTRYDDEDHYGVVIEKNVGEVKTTRGRCWVLTENSATSTKILIGRGIQIKADVSSRLAEEGRPVTYSEAGAEGCDLLIPRVMPYPWLMQEWRENEDVFESQINQNPRPVSSITFLRSDLVNATVGFDKIPFGGPISQTWDFAYSQKKGRDFATGSSGMWSPEKGQFFVQDLVRSRFKPNDLAQAVVDFARKWRPFVVGIEKSNGADFLEPTIIEKAKQTEDPHVIHVCSHIEWYAVENNVDAKRARMGTMQPWIVEGRLKFASYIPYLEILYDEFERCMASKSARNDIPDVISQQLRYAITVSRKEPDSPGMSSWNPGEAMWNMIFEEADAFGRIGGAIPTPIAIPVEPEPDVERTPYAPGVDNILGDGLIG